MFDETKPIFLQLSQALAEQVLRGDYAAGDQVPSTNELAAFHRINPATAGKALNHLLDLGILEKRRGIGMFVTPGASERIAFTRNSAFIESFITPMVTEARVLGISAPELLRIIEKEAEH